MQELANMACYKANKNDKFMESGTQERLRYEKMITFQKEQMALVATASIF